AAIRVLGLDAVYVALRTSAPELTTVLAALAAVGGAGNVTVPHKEAAERCVARKTDVCARVGACNTFWTEHGALVGDNTDVAGHLHAALDLVYAPGGTRWVRTLTAAGVRAQDGREVLVHQGAAAFSRFFADEAAPLEVMRAAVSRALGA